MKSLFNIAGLAALAIAGLVVLMSSAYTVHETKQVIITQFGQVIGDPVTAPGLHFKTPFIQDIVELDKRILEWDGNPREMTTKEKTYIMVDTFARWRISDPRLFLEGLRDESRALSRLDDNIGSATRNAIAQHNLAEVIRTTMDRQPAIDNQLREAGESIGLLSKITRGRSLLESDILERAQSKLANTGIELLDVRIKRINYNATVRDEIYLQMISERQQIAERFRSEGAGEAARIIGSKERDLKKIESEAYKKVQEIEGAADAKATEIYARAYDQSPEAREFYEFLKTMEAYQTMLDGDSTLILSTDSDIFKYLKNISPNDASTTKKSSPRPFDPAR